MSENNDKNRLRKAYEHGKTVGTYVLSSLPERYAPLTFDSWYNQLIAQEQANEKEETTSNCTMHDVSHRFCICDGHGYSETEKCDECKKPLPPY